MDIEKINDDQIKFVLHKSDLEERDITIGDLSYGSEKSQELFREILEEAILHCDFRTDGHVPFVVEAVPMSGESLMIIITRAPDKEALNSRFDILPLTRNESKFVEKAVTPPEEPKPVRAKAEKASVVYAFESLDNVCAACAAVRKVYKGASDLVKYDGRYHLILGAAPAAKAAPHAFELGLADFGRKQSASPMARMFLLEHGEILVRDAAVTQLAGLHS